MSLDSAEGKSTWFLPVLRFPPSYYHTETCAPSFRSRLDRRFYLGYSSWVDSDLRSSLSLSVLPNCFDGCCTSGPFAVPFFFLFLPSVTLGQICGPASGVFSVSSRRGRLGFWCCLFNEGFDCRALAELALQYNVFGGFSLPYSSGCKFLLLYRNTKLSSLTDTPVKWGGGGISVRHSHKEAFISALENGWRGFYYFVGFV